MEALRRGTLRHPDRYIMKSLSLRGILEYSKSVPLLSLNVLKQALHLYLLYTPHNYNRQRTRIDTPNLPQKPSSIGLRHKYGQKIRQHPTTVGKAVK
jgi:hypothetical protein